MNGMGPIDTDCVVKREKFREGVCLEREAMSSARETLTLRQDFGHKFDLGGESFFEL